MKKIYHTGLLYIFLFLFPLSVKSQMDVEKISLTVLKSKAIGKRFIFGKWDEKGGMEYHLIYLGSTKTNNGKIYKIMNLVWLWGLSRRATNRILVFNGKNQYVGNYYLTMITDLPTQLENRKLIFENISSDCDRKVVSKISLANGLPKEFFRKCTRESGDIYSFTNE